MAWRIWLPFKMPNQSKTSVFLAVLALLPGALTVTASAAGYRFNHYVASLQVTSSPSSGSAPTFELSSAVLTLSPALVGQSSEKSFSVLNTGSTSVDVTGVTIGGLNPEDFSASTNCPGSLAALSSCDVTVIGTPSLQGTRQATLNVATSAGAQQVEVSQVGLQSVGALAATFGSSADFGVIGYGTTAQRHFVYQNTGNLSLTGVTASVSGSTLSLANNLCGTAAAPVTLEPGQSCTVSVQYAPLTLETLSGTSLTVQSSATNSPSSLSLTGQAEHPTITSVDFSKGAFDAISGSALKPQSADASLVGGVAWFNPASTGVPSFKYDTPAKISFGASEDFTIQAWVYPTRAPNANTAMHVLWPQSADALGFQYAKGGWTGNVNAINVAVAGKQDFPFAVTLANNAWSHIAAVRSAGKLRVYVNGVAHANAPTMGWAVSTPLVSQIGGSTTAGHFWAGAIGSMSVHRGAVYTGNFTPKGQPTYAP